MKGQAEMMGLALIMVLLAVGFLLYVKFALVPDTTPLPRTQLGQTFVNSLVKTEIDCGPSLYTVEELLVMVATENENCDAQGSLQTNIDNFLNQSLDLWGINYRLTIVNQKTEAPIGLPVFVNRNIPLEEQCNENMDRVADVYPVSLYPIPGNLEVRLEQCEQKR